jgi:hypothetical protein
LINMSYCALFTYFAAFELNHRTLRRQPSLAAGALARSLWNTVPLPCSCYPSLLLAQALAAPSTYDLLQQRCATIKAHHSTEPGHPGAWRRRR